MPKLCFVGDVHGQLAQMYAGLKNWQDRTGTKIDGVVQVGDLGAYRSGTTWSSWFQKRYPVPIPTWAIMGNHEDPKAIGDWMESPEQIPNMRLLPDGQITDVLGVQLGVVWGNYSPISWLNPERVRRNRETGENDRIAMHIDRVAVERLTANRNHMDVLVTHETAASTLPFKFHGQEMSSFIRGLLGLEENEEVAGCPAFNGLLKIFKPQYYFFGHLHCFDEGIVGNTHYTCLNAINYPGGPWFKVVEFEDFKLEPIHEASVPVGELVAA